MWRFSAFIVLILISITRLGIHANPLVPCFYIFGDSLSDPGNNNRLKTKAKANYRPYGIDFPGGLSTGRFTNGRTTVDEIAKQLGLRHLIPPFSTTKGYDIRNGVNYASGGAGIRRETGRKNLGEVVSFDMQISNHKKVASKLNTVFNGSAQAHLKKCLYTVNIGSNDFINNYFMPEHYTTSRKFSIDAYAQTLIRSYKKKLQILYENGARKVAVFGVGLVGCSLGQVKRNRLHGSCVKEINDAVEIFNAKLKSLVEVLNHKCSDAKYTYINSPGMQIGATDGITVPDRPCCELREDYQCKESSKICENRSAYYFWDGYHPTEAVHKIVGSRAFKSKNPNEFHPLNIQSLVRYKL